MVTVEGPEELVLESVMIWVRHFLCAPLVPKRPSAPSHWKALNSLPSEITVL